MYLKTMEKQKLLIAMKMNEKREIAVQYKH